ncbi:MAG: hypothetical protein K1Y36_26085 [Blastocatellia bacterium]|nr:hypothetical protein [Blastocatellia bacterium]
MPKTVFTIEVAEAVAESLNSEATRQKISPESRISQLLSQHHEEFLQFPDGMLREGRRQLIEVLSQVSCLRNFTSSGVDFRFWWVRFELDTTSPIAWTVVRKLGLFLNTQSLEMMLPTVFKPVPGEWPDAPFCWEISSTAPRLDPTEVAEWLKHQLPQPLGDAAAWMQEQS